MEKNVPPTLFVAPGLASKLARDHKVPVERAQDVLREEAAKMIEIYKSNKSVAFFDDIHRAALHVIGENNALEVDVFTAILKDLEICDSVLMQIKGILKKAYSAEKRTEFVLGLHRFWEKLAKHLQEALIEVFERLQKYIAEPPAEPSENDARLISILARAEKFVPDYVNKNKAKAFQLDRIEMINELLSKLSSKKDSEENPWS